jgi:hypothetical protein
MPVIMYYHLIVISVIGYVVRKIAVPPGGGGLR